MSQNEFDVLGALELHLWISDVDVTKRCVSHALTTILEENRNSFPNCQSKMEKFLEELALLQEQDKVPKSKKKGRMQPDHSKLASESELEGFYSGSAKPFAMATSICAKWAESSMKKGEAEEKQEGTLTIKDEFAQMVSWTHYSAQKTLLVTKEDWLSPESTYRLFLIYNKLLLRDDTTDLEVSQFNAFLLKMVSITGYIWSPQLEYQKKGTQSINFPEFLTVLAEYFSNLHLDADFTCQMILELYNFIVLGILKKGYLVKRGHFRRNWNRRYFILRLNNLTYYEDEVQTKPKRSIVLNRMTKLVNVRDSESSKHPKQFVITCGETEVDYQICAEDHKSKQEWLLVVRKALALEKIRNPLDKEEFVSSVEQWKKSVYGAVPNLATEEDRSQGRVPAMQEEATSVISKDSEQKITSTNGDLKPATIVQTSDGISHSEMVEHASHEPGETSHQSRLYQKLIPSTQDEVVKPSEYQPLLSAQDSASVTTDSKDSSSVPKRRHSYINVEETSVDEKKEDKENHSSSSLGAEVKQKRHSYLNVEDVEDLQDKEKEEENGTKNDIQDLPNPSTDSELYSVPKPKPKPRPRQVKPAS